MMEHRRSSSDYGPGLSSLFPPRASSRLGVASLASLAHALPPRSHSRTDNYSGSSSTMTSPPSASKMHMSPSKAGLIAGRTYDAKVITREMHRLGTLSHLPSGLALAPGLVSAASSSTLTLPVAASISQSLSSGSSSDFWAQLHIHVLPLFNGEPLQNPIEDLNGLVKRHIEAVMSRGPSRALITLENDVAELINSGMITINAKLTGVDDEKLMSRIVEIWGFFWDQVLPYVEGVFLPLQTEPLLLSLYRTPKPLRPSSPSFQESSNGLMGSPSQTTIDVRSLALRAFRDKIIYPIANRLETRLLSKEREHENPEHQQPRLRQMLLVLFSQAHQTHFLSLTSPSPEPTPQEQAVRKLLDAISPRTPLLHSNSNVSGLGRPPSFLSGGLPRDRRGRVGGKPIMQLQASDTDGESLEGHGRVLSDDDGGETPRNGFVGAGKRNGLGIRNERHRERDRELLESLRSPDKDDNEAKRVGGWGLGAGKEDRATDEDEDEDQGDWDRVQAVVERMVGMVSMNGGDLSQHRRLI